MGSEEPTRQPSNKAGDRPLVQDSKRGSRVALGAGLGGGLVVLGQAAKLALDAFGLGTAREDASNLATLTYEILEGLSGVGLAGIGVACLAGAALYFLATTAFARRVVEFLRRHSLATATAPLYLAFFLALYFGRSEFVQVRGELRTEVESARKRGEASSTALREQFAREHEQFAGRAKKTDERLEELRGSINELGRKHLQDYISSGRQAQQESDLNKLRQNAILWFIRAQAAYPELLEDPGSFSTALWAPSSSGAEVRELINKQIKILEAAKRQ